MKRYFALALVLLSAMAARAAEAPRARLHVNFGQAAPEQILAADSGGPWALTTDPSEEVDDARSLKGDSRGEGGEWNEFFHSKAGLFAPKVAYRVSFDYKILARAEGARFYALFRRSGPNAWISDKFTSWQGEPGRTGHVALSFFPGSADDFYLIIGIQNRGAVSLNNIVIQTDPAHTPPDARLPAPRRTWASPGRTAYYVDSARGSDANDGKSAARPWRTLRKVNAGTFGPGDRILLRAGSAWAGYLCPGGSGTPARPIVLTRYGAGPKPRLRGQERTLATVYLHNVQGWEVRGLDISNAGRVPVPKLAGMEVDLDGFGTARHIVLGGLDVHDVTGSDVKDEGGGNGIFINRGGGAAKSRYDGLLIENCRLVRTDRNGITMDGYPSRSDWYPNRHVVIRGNTLEDIGGDGIVPIGCDGALVEHNVLRGGRRRAQDYAAGIWPWSCDNTVVQFNEVSGMKGGKDGEGYDSDWNCRHTLFQYNYSHDNDGGFMLICDDGEMKSDFSAGNVGTVIRYNVSVNDGLHTFNITGPCRDTRIYNNVFYVGKGRRLKAVASGNWGGAYPADTRFANNVFYVASGGQAGFDLGGMTGTAFDHNAFWGRFSNRPADAHAVLFDPKLSAPGGADPRGYAPRPGSPCLRAGLSIAGNGGRDFQGRPVPAGEPPTVGAFQNPVERPRTAAHE